VGNLVRQKDPTGERAAPTNRITPLLKALNPEKPHQSSGLICGNGSAKSGKGGYLTENIAEAG